MSSIIYVAISKGRIDNSNYRIKSSVKDLSRVREIMSCEQLAILFSNHSNHELRTHEGKIPNFLQPKFKYQSQINIFCRNNGKHGQGTQSTKMGADSLAKNTLNAPKNFSPICLPKPRRLKEGVAERNPLLYNQNS